LFSLFCSNNAFCKITYASERLEGETNAGFIEENPGSQRQKACKKPRKSYTFQRAQKW